MQVDLSPDQLAFVRSAIERGRFDREEDAVREALALWERRERKRAEILDAVDEAEASLSRGEGRLLTESSVRALADGAKLGGRRHLADSGQTSR